MPVCNYCPHLKHSCIIKSSTTAFQIFSPQSNSRKQKFARMQALLAKITERQRDISAARAKSRTLSSSSEVQAAQERMQEEIDEVTTFCKQVKTKLLELDSINGELLADQQV